jgi:coenzyme F420-reducing hydrogenase delta subunit
MSVRFSTEYPDENERIQAYTNVKKRLILRKNRIDTLKMSEKWKYILQEFLNHMIQLLDKKIAELS